MVFGLVNNLEISCYYLEIFLIYEEYNNDICKMLNYYDLNVWILGCWNGYICYLKGVEKIVDFLILIGVMNFMLKFEDVWIVCDMWNLVNCLVNCEIVNLNKIIDVVLK